MPTKFSFDNATRILVPLLFMLVGFYLALSSIITLSYIDNTKESKAPTVVRFDSAFRSMQRVSVINPAQLRKLDSLSDVAWASLKDLNQLRANSGLSGEALQVFKRNLAFVIRTFTQHMVYLNNQKSTTITRYNKYDHALKSYYTQATVQFNDQVNKLPPNLLSSYSESLTNFLMQLPYETFFANSFNSYATNHMLYMQAINTAHNDLVVLRDELKAGLPANDLISIYNLPREEDYKYVDKETVRLRTPEPGVLGEDWGVFKPFISWFAGSRNIDVLLLLGMIGFGLFGSAISLNITAATRSREESGEEKEKKAKVSHNVMLVLVRGFSATVVVFLAIRGGIAILNNGSNNPNPLILFLFCFIGSVFSDPIWVWAKNKIDKTFPGEGGTASAVEKNRQPALVDGKLTEPLAIKEG